MIHTEYQDQREDVLGTRREDNLYPVGDTIIGTCSKCRGPVCVPSIWFGATPVPTCQQCGAKKKAAYGPIIEME